MHARTCVCVSAWLCVWSMCTNLFGVRPSCMVHVHVMWPTGVVCNLHTGRLYDLLLVGCIGYGQGVLPFGWVGILMTWWVVYWGEGMSGLLTRYMTYCQPRDTLPTGKMSGLLQGRQNREQGGDCSPNVDFGKHCPPPNDRMLITNYLWMLICVYSDKNSRVCFIHGQNAHRHQRSRKSEQS